MVMYKVKDNSTYFYCISAVINIDKRHFADVCPAVWLHELMFDAAGLEGTPSSKRERDFGRADGATRAKSKDRGAWFRQLLRLQWERVSGRVTHACP